MTTGTAGPAKKPIPVEMWSDMRKADRLSAEEIATTVNLSRERILAVGERHGFTEDDMIRHSLVSGPDALHPPTPGTKLQPYLTKLAELLSRNATKSDTLHGVLDNESVAAISAAITHLQNRDQS